MKEFCLVPKNIAEKYLIKKKNEAIEDGNKSEAVKKSVSLGGGNVKQGRTEKVKKKIKKNPSSTEKTKKSSVNKKKKKKKTKKILADKIKKVPLAIQDQMKYPVRRNRLGNSTLSNLDHLITTRFHSTDNRDKAASILQYLKGKQNISWDEAGNLITPVVGYNIIDIIHDLLMKRKQLPADKEAFYRLFIDQVDFPKISIDNINAKKQLIKHEWVSY